MTNTVKFYTNKSNANRAGNKQFGANCFTVESSDEGFYVMQIVVKSKDKPTTIQGLPYVQTSTIKRPCKQVWHIADSMPGKSRKEVLAACIKKGIAFYTARTQYQQWSQCNKSMAATAAAQATTPA